MAEGQILSWTGYEHEHVERGTDWFWALGVVAVCIAVVAVIMNDVLFALLIIIAATVIGMLAKVPPELTEFEVSDRGVRIGPDMHRFNEILAFWVEDEEDTRPLLLVDTKKFMSPNLVIPLDGVDPAHVRDIMRKHSKEVPMREPLAHKILEFFGF
jgi:hypothetical protein